MKSKLLTFLLALSLVANAYFVISSEGMPTLYKGQIEEMLASLNNPQKVNGNLQAQTNQNNQSLNSHDSNPDYNQKDVSELENYSKTSLRGLQGYAILQGPAVYQSVQSDPTDPYGRQSVTEEGTLINISAEVQEEKAAYWSRQLH